jgi:uncharacterized protein (UPF0297 family)
MPLCSVILEFVEMSKLLFAKDTNEAKRLSNLYRQKKLRRIYRGIYTDDLESPIEGIVLRHWMQMLPHIVSNGILSFRTAIDLKPSQFKGQAIVFVTSSYSKTIALPGLLIKVLKGNSKDHTEQLLPNIAKSNTPRMLLENLAAMRGPYKNSKIIGVPGVENFLAKELVLRNEKILNEYRDAAKEIANDLGYAAEYKKLNQIIGALLSTHPDNILSTQYAKAVAKKEPFDNARIKLFEELVLYIKKCKFINRSYEYRKISFKSLFRSLFF